MLDDLNTREYKYQQKIHYRLLTLLKLPLFLNEEDIDTLVVYSIKALMNGDSSENSLVRLTKLDCHQTNVIIQKKVLVIMRLEKEEKVHLSEKEYESLKKIKDLSLLLFNKRESKNE